uniref:Uncharacterized protein n=1 Tax=Arion vulgaris TaxID=1028688 RepID=A0A0B6ZDX3_9EUPU
MKCIAQVAVPCTCITVSVIYMGLSGAGYSVIPADSISPASSISRMTQLVTSSN